MAAAATTIPSRQRKANIVPTIAATATSPRSPAARRDAETSSKRRKQKTVGAVALSKVVDDTLYCLCKTPYDEAKLASFRLQL